jgi:hypothetical protein
VNEDEGGIRECLVQKPYRPAAWAINVDGIHTSCRVEALGKGFMIICVYQLNGNYDLQLWGLGAALVF